MSCYHPLARITENAMPFLPERFWSRFSNGGYICSLDELNFIKERIYPLRSDMYQQIPCGHCIGCRLDYSRDWATRCVLEAKQYKYNVFLTLTYNDENLPYTYLCDKIDGTVTEVPVLVRKDLQDFLKRLRFYWDKNYDPSKPNTPNFCCESSQIRVYYCGEYGEIGHRPHYHLILFNCQIPDLEPIKKSVDGSTLYTSKTISDLWHNKGFVSIGAVTWNSCAYVARYIMKKSKGQTAKDEKELFCYEDPVSGVFVDGLPSEFVGMSRRPGIAKTWYDKNSDTIYTFDKVYYLKGEEVQEAQPPKYFDRLFKANHGEGAFEPIKKKRRIASEASNRALEAKLGCSLEEYRERQERGKLKQLGALKRDKV